MKKLFITLVLACATLPAMAQPYHGHGIRHHGHHGHHWRHNGSGNWIPVLIGGAIVGAAIANSKEPLVVQPQVVVQPQPSVYVQRQTVCTEWKEIQHPDGQIYRERTCTQ
jgi:hypothetical protein